MSEAEVRSELKTRLGALEARIANACRRAGRQRSDVTLVVVTKTVRSEIASLIPELGAFDLGESRPQELWRKASAIPGCRWHLIGHLQRNKVERTLGIHPLLIHSVDSLPLLHAIDQEAGKRGRRVPLLLQVNSSREESKHGFPPERVAVLAPEIQQTQNVEVHGLMTMAAFEEDPERCRPTFALTRALGAELKSRLKTHPMNQLSMGMTNDFEIAIEEGATLIRIGSALLEGLS